MQASSIDIRITYNNGKQLKTSFSYMGQNMPKKWLFEGPLGGLQWSDWAYLAFQLSSHPYLCTCEIRKQSDQKYDKNIFFFHIGGSWGTPTSNPALPNCQGSKTWSQSRQMYNKGTKLPPVFHIWTPMRFFFTFLAIRGAWVAHK